MIKEVAIDFKIISRLDEKHNETFFFFFFILTLEASSAICNHNLILIYDRWRMLAWEQANKWKWLFSKLSELSVVFRQFEKKNVFTVKIALCIKSSDFTTILCLTRHKHVLCALQSVYRIEIGVPQIEWGLRFRSMNVYFLANFHQITNN